MKKQRNRKGLRALTLLSAMLIMGAAIFAGTPITAVAQGSVSSSTSQDGATTLYLYNKQASDNTPFRVNNMFPGDAVTQDYCVRVAHKADVTVKFHAAIRPGYEKLAEVLKMKVTFQNATVYDGLMRDMPESLEYKVSGNGEAELGYQITVYLDTSVGNEYKEKMLIADFVWWVEGELQSTPSSENNSGGGNAQGGDSTNLDNRPISWWLGEFIIDDLGVPLAGLPKTGDSFNALLWMVLLGGSLAVIILLFVKRKKEVRDEKK